MSRWKSTLSLLAVMAAQPAWSIEPGIVFPTPERIELTTPTQSERAGSEWSLSGRDLGLPTLEELDAAGTAAVSPTGGDEASTTEAGDGSGVAAGAPSGSAEAQASPGSVSDPVNGMSAAGPTDEELVRLLGLDLDGGDGVEITRNVRDPQTGLTTVHGQQTFQGEPVLDTSFSLTFDAQQELVRMRGQLIQGLSAPAMASDPTIDEKQALEIATDDFLRQFGDTIEATEFEVQASATEQVIFAMPETATATSAIQVTFFAVVDGEPAEPVYVIDRDTGMILERRNNLRHQQATGPGGNEKIGRYAYGSDGRSGIPVGSENGECVFQNDRILTENLNHAREGSGRAFRFACFENTTKPINGGYAPLNDAHAFGNLVFAMFEEWYGVADPFPEREGPLRLMVHYGEGYQNAFFSPLLKVFGFGDGRDRFYPLVSLDVVAHEIAHGLTNAHSGLVYKNQSGCINEAFSDMAGEVADLYLARSTDPSVANPDFEVGAGIRKGAGQALRYMHDPKRDENSIAHASQYQTGMRVHHCSGVFNKAFHLLATTDDWDAKKAFQPFLTANLTIWGPNETFASAAEGVVIAASELGYDEGAVRAAFDSVGVPVEPSM